MDTWPVLAQLPRLQDWLFTEAIHALTFGMLGPSKSTNAPFNRRESLMSIFCTEAGAPVASKWQPTMVSALMKPADSRAGFPTTMSQVMSRGLLNELVFPPAAA